MIVSIKCDVIMHFHFASLCCNAYFHRTYHALVLCNITIAYTMVAHFQLFFTLLIMLCYASLLANEKEATHHHSHGHPLQFSTTIPSSNFLCLRFTRPRKFSGAVTENHSMQMHRYNALRQRININSLCQPSGATEYAFKMVLMI